MRQYITYPPALLNAQLGLSEEVGVFIGVEGWRLALPADEERLDIALKPFFPDGITSLRLQLGLVPTRFYYGQSGGIAILTNSGVYRYEILSREDGGFLQFIDPSGKEIVSSIPIFDRNPTWYHKCILEVHFISPYDVVLSYQVIPGPSHHFGDFTIPESSSVLPPLAFTVGGQMGAYYMIYRIEVEPFAP